MNRVMKRMALPVGAALILGSSGFAYMASNTVQASYAGIGEGDVAGYVVSSIHYVSADDRFIDAIQFSLNHPADPTTMSAVVTDNTGGGRQFYTNCSEISGAGYRFSCTPTASNNVAQIWSADVLTVSAAQ